MYDAADRKDVRRAEKAAKIAENERREIVKGLMSLAPGRSWVYDLLLECSIFTTPYTGDDSSTAYNCGRQSVGLKLFGDVVATCPDEYVLMMKEANERSITADTRSRTRQHRDDQGSEPNADDYTGQDGTVYNVPDRFDDDGRPIWQNHTY